MTALDELLGVDPNDPLQALADRLIAADEDLADALRQRRLDLGLTREQVAERMGMAPEAVARVETNSLGTLREYALAVGVAIEYTVTPVLDCRVEVGGIYRARPVDPSQPSALVLVTAILSGQDIAVTLLSPDTEFGTNLDLILSSDETGLAYELLAQSDVFGYVPFTHLDRHLATVDGAVLDALDALHNGDGVDRPVAGPPVLDRADPRWAFKVAELARLHALYQPFVPIQRDA